MNINPMSVTVYDGTGPIEELQAASATHDDGGALTIKIDRPITDEEAASWRESQRGTRGGYGVPEPAPETVAERAIVFAPAAWTRYEARETR